MRTKKHENLTQANITKVIELLNPTDGSKPTKAEIKDAIRGYLDGDNVSDIAKSLYRSSAFVKGIIDRIGVPQKLAHTDYEGRRNALLPEQCVAEEFEPNERIWAIKQNYPAIVQREIKPEDAESRGYKLYLVYTVEAQQEDLEKTYFPHLSFAGKYHALPAYDMGSLRHLREYM